MFKLRYDYERVKQGMIFGKREVLGIPFEMCTFHPHHSSPLWQRRIFCVVRCSCGKTEVINIRTLIAKKMAGCCLSCRKRKPLFTHGNSKKRLYTVWNGMKHRCHCAKSSCYESYGGRGISVCDQWREDFEAFEKWAIDNWYRSGLEIDRIDNDGNYEPGNCRFTTHAVNSRNKRNNVMLLAFGESKCRAAWSSDDRCVVSYSTLRGRINLGWDAESAITTPVAAEAACEETGEA